MAKIMFYLIIFLIYLLFIFHKERWTKIGIIKWANNSLDVVPFQTKGDFEEFVVEEGIGGWGGGGLRVVVGGRQLIWIRNHDQKKEKTGIWNLSSMTFSFIMRFMWGVDTNKSVVLSLGAYRCRCSKAAGVFVLRGARERGKGKGVLTIPHNPCTDYFPCVTRLTGFFSYLFYTFILPRSCKSYTVGDIIIDSPHEPYHCQPNYS